MSNHSLGQAGDVDDTLRAHVRQLSDALWELDSARSLYRKAISGAYRSSEKTGDQQWNSLTYATRVLEAEAQARILLLKAGLIGREI